MATYIYYTIADPKPDGESTVRINVTDFGGGDAADLGQLILDFAPIVKALVDGGLSKAGFGVEIPIPELTWSAISAATADVQEKAFFGFRTLAGKSPHLTIPTIKESLFTAGTKYLNTAAPAVAAFITAMEDGFTSGGNLFRFGDSNGSNFVLTKVAREAWGKYRRG